MTDSNYYRNCDESKCVSRGRVDLGDENFLYDRFEEDDVLTCYGDKRGLYFPMMCADGFHPVVVGDEPAVNVTGATKNCINELWRAYILHDFQDLPLHYFTCCPPTTSTNNPKDDALGWVGATEATTGTMTTTNSTNATSNSTETSITTSPSRHCSDPVFAPRGWSPEDGDDETVASLCTNQGARKYPRRTKNLRMTPSFLCCDSLWPLGDERNNNDETTTAGITWIETSDTTHQDEVDCIPFSNRWYDRGWLDRNRVGRTWINKRVCDFPGGDEEFRFPRPIDDEAGWDIAWTTPYQCCQTETSGPALPPYEQDSRFYIEVYTWLVLFIIAAIASAMIAIALSLPLLVQQDKRRRGRQSMGNCYSPYNLYLVYLAIPDLAVSLTFIFGVCVPMIRQQPVNHNLVGTIALTYGLANCFLNASVCRQVLVLLQGSNKRKRVPPPRLERVSLQAICVYLFSVIMFSLVYFPGVASERAFVKGDYENGNNLSTLSTAALVITGTLIFFPIVYVVYVTFIIWRRKYIPPVSNRMSVTNKANRALAIYFFRIVAVFFIVWIVGAIVGGLATGLTVVNGNNWPMFMFFTLVAVQQIATTGVILMSPVSREYVKDLVTLSYLFRNRDTCPKESKGTAVQTGTQQCQDIGNDNTLAISKTSHLTNISTDSDTHRCTTVVGSHKNAFARSSVDVWLARNDQVQHTTGSSDDGESEIHIRESIAVLKQFSSERDVVRMMQQLSVNAIDPRVSTNN